MRRIRLQMNNDVCQERERAEELSRNAATNYVASERCRRASLNPSISVCTNRPEITLTMGTVKKKFCVLFLFATASFLRATNIHFVTDVQPNPVVLNQPARFTVAADADIEEDYPFSPFEATDGVQLGYSGRASEVRSINGNETHLTLWMFDLQAPQAGTFTIPATEAICGEKTFTVPETTFTVKEEPKPVTPTPTAKKKPAASPVDTQFLLTGSFPKNWYVGQCCPANVRLLIGSTVRGQLTSYPQKDGDKFSVSKLLEDPQKNTIHHNGQAYAGLEWPTVLTALQSGSASLSFSINMELERPLSVSSLFNEDDPINALAKGLGVRSMEPRTLTTEKHTVNILPLPTPQPQNFTQAIGEFKLLPPKTIEKEFIQNEPMTLVVDVSGSGNFEACQAPKLVYSDDQWRAYEPKVNFEAKDSLGYEGTIHFTYTIVPLQEGKLPLPTVEFCYFHPIEGQYETLTSVSETLSVKPAIRPISQSSFSVPMSVASTKANATPARPKHERTITMEPITQVSPTSPFWFIQCAIAAAILFGTLLYRKTHTRSYVTQKASQQQSGSLRKALDEAFQRKDGAAVYAAAHALIEFTLKQKQTNIDAVLQNPPPSLSNAQQTQLRMLEQTYQESRFGRVNIDCPGSLDGILKLLEALS